MDNASALLLEQRGERTHGSVGGFFGICAPGSASFFGRTLGSRLLCRVFRFRFRITTRNNNKTHHSQRVAREAAVGKRAGCLIVHSRLGVHTRGDRLGARFRSRQEPLFGDDFLYVVLAYAPLFRLAHKRRGDQKVQSSLPRRSWDFRGCVFTDQTAIRGFVRSRKYGSFIFR